jgi:solute carrier family 25 protein 16
VAFATYDYVKRILLTYPRATITDENSKSRLRAPAELLAGGIAGWAGQSLSYPFEIVRRTMQIAGRNEKTGVKRIGILDTGREIYGARGVRGFFVGLTIGYIKVVPMSAVSFFVFEGVKRFLDY